MKRNTFFNTSKVINLITNIVSNNYTEIAYRDIKQISKEKYDDKMIRMVETRQCGINKIPLITNNIHVINLKRIINLKSLN